MLEIEGIRTLCKNKYLRWTNHILMRLVQRRISMDDVESAIISGEIIEPYLEDYPHPSCLILGKSVNNKYMHVVCGVSSIELYLITAYYPNNIEWEDDFKTRKELI
jgi:hypothetical protein